jgi:hypothetical protein
VINKHGGNNPLTGGDELDMPQLTFEQLNNAELMRDWKRERVAEIAANPSLADGYRAAGFGGLVREAKIMTEKIEQLTSDNEWADAHLFALREQMRAAGIQCETVAEGVAVLLQPHIEVKNIGEVLAVNAKKLDYVKKETG